MLYWILYWMLCWELGPLVGKGNDSVVGSGVGVAVGSGEIDDEGRTLGLADGCAAGLFVRYEY